MLNTASDCVSRTTSEVAACTRSRSRLRVSVISTSSLRKYDTLHWSPSSGRSPHPKPARQAAGWRTQGSLVGTAWRLPHHLRDLRKRPGRSDSVAPCSPCVHICECNSCFVFFTTCRSNRLGLFGQKHPWDGGGSYPARCRPLRPCRSLATLTRRAKRRIAK